ncbi:MAG TPA: bacillithiol system redox-active protein YtxJ [Thermoanaerobaculia bacterium]|nr:bacillithiol system redox-active protein YtxJ [Thermoanaerobaculia bacterium]
MSTVATIRPLTQPAEVEAAVERSHRRPVWLFKHSLTCGISARAIREYQRFAAEQGEESELLVLEIQNARPASQAVEQSTGVRHESPQALLLAGGRAVWNASHSRITQAALAAAAAEARAGAPVPGAPADPAPA